MVLTIPIKGVKYFAGSKRCLCYFLLKESNQRTWALRFAHALTLHKCGLLHLLQLAKTSENFRKFRNLHSTCFALECKLLPASSAIFIRDSPEPDNFVDSASPLPRNYMRHTGGVILSGSEESHLIILYPQMYKFSFSANTFIDSI